MQPVGLQEWIHRLEEGEWTKYIRLAFLILALLGITALWHLREAKNYLALGFPGDFETTADAAVQYLDLLANDLPLDEYSTFIERIQKVTPADVQIWPCSMKIALRSTSTRGNARASASHADQCVVARLPSSRPAAARMNEPLHTDAMRRVVGATCCSQPSSTGSKAAASVRASVRSRSSAGSSGRS